ncbi:hypothetical protein RI367_003422 [Sorochytrium milnesiophthora]
MPAPQTPNKKDRLMAAFVLAALDGAWRRLLSTMHQQGTLMSLPPPSAPETALNTTSVDGGVSSDSAGAHADFQQLLAGARAQLGPTPSKHPAYTVVDGRAEPSVAELRATIGVLTATVLELRGFQAEFAAQLHEALAEIRKSQAEQREIQAEAKKWLTVVTAVTSTIRPGPSVTTLPDPSSGQPKPSTPHPSHQQLEHPSSQL